MDRSEVIPTAPAHPRRRAGRFVTAGIAVAVIAIGAWQFLGSGPLPEGVSREEYAAAERRIRESFRREPTRVAVFSFLGERAAAEDRLAVAVACFREVPSDDPSYGLSARLQEGQSLLALDRAREAEEALREYLSLAAKADRVPSEHIAEARRALAYILSVELRFEERKPILAALHASGLANVNDSKQYHFPTLLISRSAFGRGKLRRFLEQDPTEPRLIAARGRYEAGSGDLDAAKETLEGLFRLRPDDLACAAALLECCYEADDLKRFGEVAKSLPGYAAGEPWLLTQMRGQHAILDGWPEDAVEAFARVLAEDPANPVCRMGLARAFGGSGRPAEREKALKISLALSRIRVGLPKVTESDPAAALDLAAECETAGLSDAAVMFRGHAERIARRLGGGRGAMASHREAGS